MPDDKQSPQRLAAQVRAALESADLAAIGELLDPDVHWGPPDEREPSCQNRDQVLAWYQRGGDAGVRASVTEVVVVEDKMLVGLRVVGRAAAEENAGEADRWQVLTLRGGRVVDIRGFDDQSEAATRVGLAV